MTRQTEVLFQDAAPPAPRPRRARRPFAARSAPARATEPGPKRWRTIWISDVHLGTRACRAEALLAFLGQNVSENLYLVGDIVDGWGIARSWYWNEEHNQVLKAILERSSRGARVSYVTGNHDEFLRGYAGLMLGGIALKNEAVHHTADGRKLLVTHGDQFDACVRNRRWLALLGDRAYEACQHLNVVLNAVRRPFGLEHWSLADYLKRILVVHGNVHLLGLRSLDRDDHAPPHRIPIWPQNDKGTRGRRSIGDQAGGNSPQRASLLRARRTKLASLPGRSRRHCMALHEERMLPRLDA